MIQPIQKEKKPGNEPSFPVVVWDLPTRLFHWLLVVLIATSFATGLVGGNAMRYHEWSGVGILALLVFRFIWGFAGGTHARFSSFLKGPSAVVRYGIAMVRGDAPRYLGHNPLGGWSVVAMLAAVLLQVSTGLFASDDIFTEGPLYHLVSNETSRWLTGIHLVNRYVIVGLVAVHLFAVLFHLLAKGENLILPMITGRKHWERASGSAGGGTLKAAVIAGATALLVYLFIY